MNSEQYIKNMDKEIGQRIRDLRVKSNLTVEELSDFLVITPGYYGLIERGERSLPIRYLVTLSTIFQVSQEYITTGSGKKPIKFTNPKVFLENAIKLYSSCHITK